MDINRIEHLNKMNLEKILRSKGEYLTYMVNMELYNNFQEDYRTFDTYDN
jgi:hypothetical protein